MRVALKEKELLIFDQNMTELLILLAAHIR